MRTSVNGLIPSVTTSLRVFCFQTVTGWVCIDFKWFPAVPGWLYIVPAGHFIWGSTALLQNCLWSEIKEALPEEAQVCLWKMLFAPEKRICLPADSPSSLEDAGIMEALVQGVAEVSDAPAHLVQKDSTLHWYYELATTFCQVVAQWNDGDKQKGIPHFAASLCQQERTLERACRETFGKPPAVILRYYKALLGARLLADTDLKLTDIAAYLGYEQEGNCTRFLKGKFGMCPMEFRRRILELNEEA